MEIYVLDSTCNMCVCAYGEVSILIGIHDHFHLLLLCSSFQSDSNGISSINCALESIHSALAVMAHNQMPKQLYKEEVYALV